MNTSYALFVADKPTSEDKRAFAYWQSFQNEASKLAKQVSGLEMPTECLWQIPLESALPFLCRLVRLAEDNGIKHKVCVLNQKPQWCDSKLAV